LTFLDEASTANRYAAQLRRQGIRAIILLIHEGGEQAADPHPNSCNDLKGPIVPIVSKLSPDINVVLSGHTHQFYNCVINGRTVTSASAFGRMMTRVKLTISPSTGALIDVSAVNEIVTRDVPKETAQSAILARYRPLAAPIAGRVIGSAIADITRETNAAGESALGDLVADAQLAATSDTAHGGAAVAFMNPTGLRGDILGGSGGTPRPVTYNDVFTIQPFGDVVIVGTMSGASIKRVLEQQFDNPFPGGRRFLQLSSGFSYRYSLGNPPGQRVDAPSIMINGHTISADQRVRVAFNNFLAEGGDGFTGFRQATNQVVGAGDLDALTAYIEAHSPLSPPAMNRITSN
jgi:5'-nucleotidase